MMYSMKRPATAGVALAAVLILGGCADYNWKMPGVYRIPVQQGTVIEQSMLDQLRAGMPKEQVRFVMGSPVITDPFRNNRWDYIYSFKTGSDSVREQRHLTLYFDEEDRLTRVAGDVVPGDPALRSDEARTARKEPEQFVVPERSKPGLLSRLFGFGSSRVERDDSESPQRQDIEMIENPDDMGGEL